MHSHKHNIFKTAERQRDKPVFHLHSFHAVQVEDSQDDGNQKDDNAAHTDAYIKHLSGAGWTGHTVYCGMSHMNNHTRINRSSLYLLYPFRNQCNTFHVFARTKAAPVELVLNQRYKINCISATEAANWVNGSLKWRLSLEFHV